MVSDSVRPHRWQPIRLHRPWGSPGKNAGVGCHFLLQCMKWKVKGKSLSRVWLLATPWTAAYQAPLSMGFSRQECWSGVPLPSPDFIYIRPLILAILSVWDTFTSDLPKADLCYSLGFSLDVTSSVEINSHLSLSEIGFYCCLYLLWAFKVTLVLRTRLPVWEV